MERETNRAEALARRRHVQAESEARSSAALLEAQALDIRAVTAAQAPAIPEYRLAARKPPKAPVPGDGRADGGVAPSGLSRTRRRHPKGGGRRVRDWTWGQPGKRPVLRSAQRRSA